MDLSDFNLRVIKEAEKFAQKNNIQLIKCKVEGVPATNQIKCPGFIYNYQMLRYGYVGASGEILICVNDLFKLYGFENRRIFQMCKQYAPQASLLIFPFANLHFRLVFSNNHETFELIKGSLSTKNKDRRENLSQLLDRAIFVTVVNPSMPERKMKRA